LLVKLACCCFSTEKGMPGHWSAETVVKCLAVPLVPSPSPIRDKRAYYLVIIAE
jgi:hypothetical protein